MLKWLGEACRRAREAAGASQLDVALKMSPRRDGEHVSPSSISRFERGEPSDRLDEKLDGYALVTGQLPRDLWEAALRLADSGRAFVGETRPRPESSGLDPDGRISRLERAGAVRAARAPVVKSVLSTPPQPLRDVSAVDVLINERRSGR